MVGKEIAGGEYGSGERACRRKKAAKMAWVRAWWRGGMNLSEKREEKLVSVLFKTKSKSTPS